MSELFSEAWMQRFMEQWNKEAELVKALGEVGFAGTVGYGFEPEDNPRGVIVVEDGRVVSAGEYQDQDLDWDIRCTESLWKKWIDKPPGMMALGMAFTSGKLKFRAGDYASMLKDRKMTEPFITSFSVMGKV